MSDFDQLPEFHVNDFVEIAYHNDTSGRDVKERGVIDEIDDGEYPCIEIECGGKRGLRIVWGIDGDGPPAVSTLGYKERYIGDEGSIELIAEGDHDA